MKIIAERKKPNEKRSKKRNGKNSVESKLKKEGKEERTVRPRKT